MRITTGRVRDGQVDLRDAELPEGSQVTVLSRDVSAPFELDSEEEAVLVAALEEVERGETVDDSRLRELLRTE